MNIQCLRESNWHWFFRKSYDYSAKASSGTDKMECQQDVAVKDSIIDFKQTRNYQKARKQSGSKPYAISSANDGGRDEQYTEGKRSHDQVQEQLFLSFSAAQGINVPSWVPQSSIRQMLCFNALCLHW